MRRILIVFLLLNLCFSTLFSQNAQLEGYVFEEGNRGFLNLVKVSLTDATSGQVLETKETNKEGFFSFSAPAGASLRVSAEKDVFEKWDTVLTAPASGKTFLKIEMTRKPGYLFDATLAEARTPGKEEMDAIPDVRIDIFNNTTGKEEWVAESHPASFFKFTFVPGNWYTLLLRKKGYLTKRIEAHVNIDGCIICLDGISDLRPGVTDNLTKENTQGTLLANIELQPVKLQQTFKIENIYYDLNKWNIRPDAAKELDKTVRVLRDNPAISVEMGSHTDCRATGEYNLDLSQKRAQSCVGYLVSQGIALARLSARGYGETQLVNRCADGVTCTEEEHQQNRRTELKITGIAEEVEEEYKPLQTIIVEENFEKEIQKPGFGQQVKIKAGEKLPDEIRSDIQKVKTGGAIWIQQGSGGVDTFRLEGRKAEFRVEGTPAGEPGQKFEFQQEGGQRANWVQEKGAATQRPPKLLPKNYSGYTIELLNVQAELPLSHSVFSKFDDLRLEKNSQGAISYFIGHFGSKADALLFLKEKIEADFPGALVVSFKEGKRLTE